MTVIHSKMLSLLPFLKWFPITGDKLRADLAAGITVALILVPQSMAYAQLAGLPVVYGLYASFIPVIIASLWGSSSQLHTGPVAMLSLMSAAALIPFASPGSASFIELSIMLAMMVGVLRLVLGVFRLGSIVNLLSSPVVVGFTNAAALIIGLSQLNKIIGVPFPRSENYLADLWRVVEQIPDLHVYTLLFSISALVAIYAIRRISPVLPGILIVVLVSIVVSAVTGYENKVSVELSEIKSEKSSHLLSDYIVVNTRTDELITEIANKKRTVTELKEAGGLENIQQAANLLAEISVMEHQLDLLKTENIQKTLELHAIKFHINEAGEQRQVGTLDEPAGKVTGDEITWRFTGVDDNRIVLSSGGDVVGNIPQGLPSLNMPTIQWDLVLSLFPAAVVMALIGFMEATSISKAIASQTGEKIDASKELVGQGLANIVGSFFGSFTVSGSFSRSAVAAKSGAKTGLFAIVSALGVMLVLLFFTPYLYHLPQAVLAVIVMVAVFSLIRIKPLLQAWTVDRVGASIGVITFVATLIMAPSIANGILLGVCLTVLHYLIRTMKPRSEIVSRKSDGTLGGIEAHNLQPMSERFVPVRFDGSLTFTNVSYFEDIILEAQHRFPRARAIVVIGSGINDMDASGEEKVREVNARLNKLGVSLMFSGLKHQVLNLFKQSGLYEELGEDRFFCDKQTALRKLFSDYEASNDYDQTAELSCNVRQMLDRSKLVVTSNRRFLL